MTNIIEDGIYIEKPPLSEEHIKVMKEIGKKALMSMLDGDTLTIRDKSFKINISLTKIKESNND